MKSVIESSIFEGKDCFIPVPFGYHAVLLFNIPYNVDNSEHVLLRLGGTGR